MTNYTTTQLHDNTTTRQQAYKPTSQPDITTTRLHDYTTTRLHDYTTARQQDYMTTQLHDNATTWQRDYMTTQQHNYMTIQPYDCKYAPWDDNSMMISVIYYFHDKIWWLVSAAFLPCLNYLPLYLNWMLKGDRFICRKIWPQADKRYPTIT